MSKVIRQVDSDWYWDEEYYQYRDGDGNLIPYHEVVALTFESIIASQNSFGALASHVYSGEVSREIWLVQFRSELKDEYIRQYLAGIGGRQNMTQSDWGIVGSQLKQQYAFANGFYDDIPNLSEAQIRSRMNQYISSSHQAYERAHGVTAKKWGAEYAIWDINPAAENCETCLRRNALGEQEIGPRGGFMDPLDGIECWPADGTTDCISNCVCTLRYVNKNGEVFKG